MTADHLWYIPNQIDPAHRGDEVAADQFSLEHLTAQAEAVEANGWHGALIGTSWGRPDTFTVAAALTARTTTFEPLIAVKPGYWRPANFASAAATLDHLSSGRVRVNVVSGLDDVAAYGDDEVDRAARYDRTREFMQLIRRMWTEEHVDFTGEHFRVSGSTVLPRIAPRGARRHPPIYFGGASAEAERVAAREADVQLFWGEPLSGVQERIERLTALSAELGREHPPLEFGLRVATFVRDTTDEAWRDAERRVVQMASEYNRASEVHRRSGAVGQQRLIDLAARGEVLDDNLYTTPGRFGAGGAGTTWLVGSADDVAKSLRKYEDLGISHFVLSDTPELREVRRQGEQLLPLLREETGGPVANAVR